MREGRREGGRQARRVRLQHIGRYHNRGRGIYRGKRREIWDKHHVTCTIDINCTLVENIHTIMIVKPYL